jgi:hypothetical protein
MCKTTGSGQAADQSAWPETLTPREPTCRSRHDKADAHTLALPQGK